MITEFEKQVLKNQSTILLSLLDISERGRLHGETLINLNDRMRENLLILNPKNFKTPDEKAQDDLVGTNQKGCGLTFVYAKVDDKEFVGNCGDYDNEARVTILCEKCVKTEDSE